MTRYPRTLMGALSLALAGAGVLSAQAAENQMVYRDKVTKGRPCVDIVGIDGQGKTVKLSDYKGKVIILDVSATWCGPCNQEAPAFNRFYETHKDKGLVCITCLADGAGQAAAAKWVSKHKMTMPVIGDSKGKSGPAEKFYIAATKGYPSFYVIDQQFIAREVGAGNMERAQAVALKLLKQTAREGAAITKHPVSQTVQEGGAVSFGVEYTSETPVDFHWFKMVDGDLKNLDITTPTLTLNPVKMEDAGNYCVSLCNGTACVMSDQATLTVEKARGYRAAPVITKQPANQTAKVGENVTFTVEYTSDSPVDFHWFKNVDGDVKNLDITTPTLTLNAVKAEDAGKYSVCICNGTCCLMSEEATLTIEK